MDKLFNNSIEDPNTSIMAIHSTPANKAAASKSYTEEFLSNQSLSNPDLDNSRGEGFGTYNTAPKPITIIMHISNTPDIYTKA